MNTDQFKSIASNIFKKWWCSLLLLPFVIYSLHQTYWTLEFNIFFAITYDFPFPVSLIHLFLDNFLLAIHEAGHTFFGILGWRTLTILGGSLLEILIPLLILTYFWFNRKKIGIQLSLYLVGFSFLEVAFYIADAGSRQLPLIGGLPKEAHDWYNLLVRWNSLEHDLTIAVCLAIVASACYLTALLLPAFYQSYKYANIDLDL